MKTFRSHRADWLIAACAMLGLCGGVRAGTPDLAAPEITLVTQEGVHRAIIGAVDPSGARGAFVLNARPPTIAQVTQSGNANEVNIVQSSGSNTVGVRQEGNANSVKASQQNQSNSLEVIQQGNGNHANFTQAGGTRASVMQTGDAHQANIYQTSASPSIVIRQSGAGTLVQTTQY
ncbi:hypothetical protein [Massilia sp. Leaf139]|uniref:hypothetical protein n=1 Tax=Massilia sp. Leaf139 TaxID=1736272 RepID=UPI0006FCEB3C|nr:hypothetical protein [Massilia sp. Leaf139]KQQ87024.1 hypothetical protein ASF77_15510 [Massilia sp. Leaf139]